MGQLVLVQLAGGAGRGGRICLSSDPRRGWDAATQKPQHSLYNIFTATTTGTTVYSSWFQRAWVVAHGGHRGGCTLHAAERWRKHTARPCAVKGGKGSLCEPSRAGACFPPCSVSERRAPRNGGGRRGGSDSGEGGSGRGEEATAGKRRTRLGAGGDTIPGPPFPLLRLSNNMHSAAPPACKKQTPVVGKERTEQASPVCPDTPPPPPNCFVEPSWLASTPLIPIPPSTWRFQTPPSRATKLARGQAGPARRADAPQNGWRQVLTERLNLSRPFPSPFPSRGRLSGQRPSDRPRRGHCTGKGGQRNKNSRAGKRGTRTTKWFLNLISPTEPDRGAHFMTPPAPSLLPSVLWMAAC